MKKAKDGETRKTKNQIMKKGNPDAEWKVVRRGNAIKTSWDLKMCDDDIERNAINTKWKDVYLYTLEDLQVCVCVCVSVCVSMRQEGRRVKGARKCVVGFSLKKWQRKTGKVIFNVMEKIALSNSIY